MAGTAIGSALDLDGPLQRFGGAVEARLGGAAADGRMARALVTTSLLFCVGPLTILGSFEDGARGDILLLGIKSALDGVAALAFGASLGAGVLLSAVTVLVVQGSLTAAAYLTRGALDPGADHRRARCRRADAGRHRARAARHPPPAGCRTCSPPW